MLNRQKILLQLLRQVGRPVSRTELTKWAFLLRHESDSAGGNAFYEFVPYRLGPFSFALYQELDKLLDQNYVAQSGEHGWEAGEVAAPTLDPKVGRDVSRVVKDFAGWDIEKLLDYVYQRHPAFTVNSERMKLAKRPKTKPAVFTAGYEGISIDRFLNLLVENGVERLIDVRHNPIARRYGFHKSTLQRLTSKLDIDYVHVPELGIQSANRQNLDTMDDRESLFKVYEDTTLQDEPNSVASVADLIKERPSVLVCMEAAPECCHRSRLATAVSKITKLHIEHLRAA
tara:strand:- start:113925 stop:114782 length:858 start_codon:yes stop_codon:yes gene_type:complete